MKTGYKGNVSTQPTKKGYTSDVNIVNKPTVKVEYEKPAPMPPTLNLSTDDLAAIKDWKVGGKYKLSLEVEQTSMRQGNEYSLVSEGSEGADSSKVNANFKVLSIKEDK